MTVRRSSPLLLALLVPALVSACGGGGGKASATTAMEPRLAPKQFVAAANRVCIASDRRVYGLGTLSTDPAGWQKTADAAKRAVTEMRALRPPAAKQADFDRLLALGSELQRRIRAVHDALVKKDYAKARAAQARATELDTQIKRQAAKLGLTFCQQLLTNWPA